MANKIVLVDTSILIDFYRKTEKSSSIWFSLVKQGYGFAISVITKYEIYAGASQIQIDFWQNVFKEIIILPLDEKCVDTAVRVNANLKRKRKQIDFPDLLIASTAIAHKLTLTTPNRKHFDRIDELNLLD
jgi:predicted nucleic acid-binding protein